MTNERVETAGEPHLLLRAADGTTYAIPQGIVEAHRLSDEQWADLEAGLRADGVDVEGYIHDPYPPTGNVGTFGSGTPGPVGQYDPSRPYLGGWDGVGLRYVPPVEHVIGRRKRP